MAVSKKRKKILLIVLIILIALFLGVYMVRKLPKQIQGMIKYKVSSDVVKKQAELYEAVVEMNNQEVPRYVHRRKGDEVGENFISYKELKNDKISKVFNDFYLGGISNQMDNPEYGYVDFSFFRFQILHPTYSYGYGFYYSEKDMPVEIWTGEYIDSGTVVHKTWPITMHYWYRTEKITDNWWYYEEWWKNMPTPHDSIIGNIIEGIIDEVFPPEFIE